MNNEEIIQHLKYISDQSFSLVSFIEKLGQIKENYVQQKDESKAKQIWIYESISNIHLKYQLAFKHLQKRAYYQAWCELELIEQALKNLKRHFTYDKKTFCLWHIEKTVLNLQVIYPYNLFVSHDVIKSKKICSVCKQEILVRNPCDHFEGEIYNGEMCQSLVTESEIIGADIVPDPSSKLMVVFMKDEHSHAQIDPYNYSQIERFLEKVKDPYQLWDLEVRVKEIRKENYKNVDKNDACPCESGRSFKNCCMNRMGEKYPAYNFTLVKNHEDISSLKN